jgi:hypothetical protein
MKLFARLTLMGSGLGLIFLTAMPSYATVVGTLLTGGPGTVTVTSTGITFTENDANTSPSSSTQVGVGSTLSYSGGLVPTGSPVDINGGNVITPAVLAAGVPVTFPNEPGLSITLTSFGPGSGTACSSGMTPGQSCSPLGGLSPIILTDEGTSTNASLSFTGTATDGPGSVSNVTGLFSAPINGTPLTLSQEDSFTTTYAGHFTVTAVPEPRAISLIALAGLLMGIVVSKRRKSVA